MRNRVVWAPRRGRVPGRVRQKMAQVVAAQRMMAVRRKYRRMASHTVVARAEADQARPKEWPNTRRRLAA